MSQRGGKRSGIIISVGFGDIYRFEIMILLRVKEKSLLCYWAVDLGIGLVNMEM